MCKGYKTCCFVLGAAEARGHTQSEMLTARRVTVNQFRDIVICQRVSENEAFWPCPLWPPDVQESLGCRLLLVWQCFVSGVCSVLSAVVCSINIAESIGLTFCAYCK